MNFKFDFFLENSSTLGAPGPNPFRVSGSFSLRISPVALYLGHPSERNGQQTGHRDQHEHAESRGNGEENAEKDGQWDGEEKREEFVAEGPDGQEHAQSHAEPGRGNSSGKSRNLWPIFLEKLFVPKI